MDAVARPLVYRPILCRIGQCPVIAGCGGVALIEHKRRFTFLKIALPIGVILVPHAGSVCDAPNRVGARVSFPVIGKRDAPRQTRSLPFVVVDKGYAATEIERT